MEEGQMNCMLLLLLGSEVGSSSCCSMYYAFWLFDAVEMMLQCSPSLLLSGTRSASAAQLCARPIRCCSCCWWLLFVWPATAVQLQAAAQCEKCSAV
jgi:hypothetical protein